MHIAVDSGYSTVTALHTLYNAIAKDLPARTIIVALDMSKVFNATHMHTLIRELLQSRTPGKIMKFIGNYIKGCKAYTTLLSGDDLNDLICLINKEIGLLFIWLKSNKLSLNTRNTFYFLFHRTRIKGNYSVVKINDWVLNRVYNVGVIIDHKLKRCDTYHMYRI